MRVLVTGATGLLGTSLVPHLSECVVLTRDPVRARRRLPSVEAHTWDPGAQHAPAEALQGIDAVFHLAGESVAEGRWTPEKKRRIRESRVAGTRNLVGGLAALRRKPAVLVCASAVGYYGDGGDALLDESAAPGGDFLAEVVGSWEQQALAAEALGIRVVCLRIGLVFARSGGALPRMLVPFRLGIGGRLGSGAQWTPWIHIDDVTGLLLHASRSNLQGPMNAVSPNPVTNAELTRTLGRLLHRPTLLPVPKVALRLALGEMGDLLLQSQRVRPAVAERSGYVFKHPELGGALAALLAGSSTEAAA